MKSFNDYSKENIKMFRDAVRNNVNIFDDITGNIQLNSHQLGCVNLYRITTVYKGKPAVLIILLPFVRQTPMQETPFPFMINYRKPSFLILTVLGLQVPQRESQLQLLELLLFKQPPSPLHALLQHRLQRRGLPVHVCRFCSGDQVREKLYCYITIMFLY